MFDQVSIIGCGLIGSSIFKGLKKVGSIKKIISYDKDKTVTEIIKNEKLSDEIFNSAGDAVKDSDLVIIATPISSHFSIAKKSFRIKETRIRRKTINKNCC